MTKAPKGERSWASSPLFVSQQLVWQALFLSASSMPSSLQGLNIVYPPPRPSDNPSQDLTPPPGFPDLSAQLDLWTNLSFASDEPFIDKHRKELAALEILDQKFADGDEAEASHERSLFINADKPARTPIDIRSEEHTSELSHDVISRMPSSA